MQLSNATYLVLDGVKHGKIAKEIAEESKKNKSTISRKFAYLTREKCIALKFRDRFKSYSLTKKGELLHKELQQVLRVLDDATLKYATDTRFPIKFRWHNLLFRIPIIKTDPEINKSLEQAGFTYGKKRAFARGWEMEIDGVPVFYTTKSFQLFPKPIWAGNLELAIKKGCVLVNSIHEKLKAMFPYIQTSMKQELCRQHIAMIGGVTIKIPEGFRYRSQTFEVDASTGVAEMESISSVYATEHMRKICAFLDDIGNEELVT